MKRKCIINSNTFNQILMYSVEALLCLSFYCDLGEEIADTAKREVFEETGIRTEFVGVVSFRHQLGYRYGCGDFYFICLMRPISEDQQIQRCEQEIAACKWVDVSYTFCLFSWVWNFMFFLENNISWALKFIDFKFMCSYTVAVFIFINTNICCKAEAQNPRKLIPK